MQHWLSYHLYPLETPDIFLLRAIKPFLNQYVWAEKGARAFFIRYEDEQGEHIRLRIRGEEAWLEESIKPALNTLMEGRGEMQERPYVPEIHRFGGEQSMVWAEEYFHVSTRVVLDLMGRPKYSYGDSIYDAIRLQLITVYNAGLSQEKVRWYFAQLMEQWLDLYFQPMDGAPLDEEARNSIKAQFQIAYKQQAKMLELGKNMLWGQLSKDALDKKHPEWLRWHRGNQLILPEFGEQLDRVLPSLLHLNANRLGIHNPDEVYIAYILAQ